MKLCRGSRSTPRRRGRGSSPRLLLAGGLLTAFARRGPSRCGVAAAPAKPRPSGAGGDDERRGRRDAHLGACATSTSASARREIIRGVSLDDRARRAPCDHRPQRRRQVDAVQPDQRPLRADPRLDPAQRPRTSTARALRDQPAGPVAQLPGHQHLPAPVGVREPALRVLWSLGYRYTFWRIAPTAARRQRERTERMLEQIRLDRAARRACGREPDLRRAARARDRHHHRRRRQRDPARRADRRHEPERDRRSSSR